MEQKLGRGLAALLGEAGKGNNESRTEIFIDINLIFSNKDQPRKSFDNDQLMELAQSIKQHGILQPIVVRQKGEKYEIIAGERRWRAAKLAELQQVPVHVVACNDSEILIFSLVENIQRADLNPIEEAEAIQTIMMESNCRQEDLSNMIAKSRSYIANAVRLLTLPEVVQRMIKEKKLSAGHGKCLVGIQNAEEIAHLAASEGWNVRQLEGALQDLRAGEKMKVQESGRSHASSMQEYEDPDAIAIAERIADIWKIQAKLKITKRGGILTLTCRSCETLEALTAVLLEQENTRQKNDEIDHEQ